MAKDVNIETCRLILRTVTMDDAEAVALAWNLDGSPISREEAVKEIRWMLGNHERNESGAFVHLCLAIIHKGDKAFIGWCGLDHRDPTKPNPVLFYLLEEAYWGRGLATEAAKAVLRHAFCTLGLAQVDGGASAENVASKRVMEKAGMRYVGRGGDGGYTFALTRREYVDKSGCD